MLGQFDEHNGYLRTEVKIKGKRRRLAIHRIVWISVHGKPKHGTLINHKDCNTLNNAIDNLEKSNPSHNTKHAYDNGLCRTDTNHNVRDSLGNFAAAPKKL